MCSQPKVITPYAGEEINRMLRVCDYDYDHNAKFPGSRNRAMILVLLDTAVRLSELAALKVSDVQSESGWIKIWGTGSRELV